MPQLDKVTFLPQFFWLLFFYLGFYFLVLKFFLPRMSRILKLRKKKMSISQDGVSSFLQESVGVSTHFNGILSRGFSTSRNIMNDNYQRTQNWLENTQENTNQIHYNHLNTKYLVSVGETSLKDNVALFQASFDIPEKLYTQLLLLKIK